jgi:plasmid maintenance system antidote protein VapI
MQNRGKTRPDKKKYKDVPGFKPTDKLRSFTHRNRETTVGWINTFLMENDMNSAMFAERMGLSYSTIRKYTAGTLKYTPDFLDRFCEVFLLDDDERKNLHTMCAREWGFRV